MPLNPVDNRLVNGAIRDFLKDHVANPFDTLRETGAVADLKRFLSHALQSRGRHMARAQIQSRTGTRALSGPIQTQRVQLAMKLQRSDGSWIELDGVVLHAEPHINVLQHHTSSPGDVIAQLRPQDVAAAIEVKASPSGAQQCQAYARDVVRLHDIAKSFGTSGHFVLLDKSLVLYGAKGRSNTNVPNINAGALSPLRICPTPPPKPNTAVEIWFINSVGTPQRCFAY